MSPLPIPPGTTLIIRGGRAMLPADNWHEPAEVDIAIAEHAIAGIAPVFAPVTGAAIEELDARGHLVLPGFINAHYHSHDVLAKGTLEEVPLESWRLYALPPQYPPRSVEEVRARTLLGALECLRSGMTTIQDMLTLYPFEDRHLDAVMEAYEQIGIRVVFSLQYADRKGLETIPYWKDIFPKDLHPLLSTAAEPERQLDLLGHFETTCLRAAPRPRVHWALGPSAPERCSPGLMARTMELARRYDVPVYSHIYESRGMALQARLTLPEPGGRRRTRPAAESCAQRLACARRDRSAGGDRHWRGAQPAGQSEDEMRNTADPRPAGCRRSHWPRMRQLQLLGRAEHVHGDEAVRAAGRGQ
jgi:guanine deaminase